MSAETEESTDRPAELATVHAKVDQITKLVSSTHHAAKYVEGAIDRVRHDVADFRDAAKVLTDGKWDHKDGPAFAQLLYAASNIFREVSLGLGALAGGFWALRAAGVL